MNRRFAINVSNILTWQFAFFKPYKQAAINKMIFCQLFLESKRIETDFMMVLGISHTIMFKFK